MSHRQSLQKANVVHHLGNGLMPITNNSNVMEPLEKGGKNKRRKIEYGSLQISYNIGIFHSKPMPMKRSIE